MSGRTADGTRPAALTMTQRRLLDEFQRDFPLSPRPFAEMGERLGVDEATVIDTLQRLQAHGFVARVGAVVTPNRMGASTLAAMAVPSERIEAVATLVSAHPEINHNYEREHHFNLWFVVTASSEADLSRVLADIEAETGLQCLQLPLLEPYHIDLGFRLAWN